MHSRLETYLNEVASRLGPLPAKARADELREMRAHLEAAYAAGLARGQSEDEAARAVLAQFGTPDVVGAETVSAWRRGRRLDRRSFWGAAACGLVLSYLVPRLLEPPVLTWFGRFHPGRVPDWAEYVLIAWFVLIPVLVGGISGALFPRRAAAGVGLAMLGGAVVIAAEVAFGVIHLPSALSAADQGRLALTLASRSIVGGVFSVGAAWAGSRWRTARAGRARVAPA